MIRREGWKEPLRRAMLHLGLGLTEAEATITHPHFSDLFCSTKLQARLTVLLVTPAEPPDLMPSPQHSFHIGPIS